jgi:hypothetical protein
MGEGNFSREQIGQKGWKLTRQLFEYEVINADKPEERFKQLVWGEASDGGDKGAYKASTGADKYFWFRLLQIPTGDDPDDEGEDSAKGQRNRPAARANADKVQHKRDEQEAAGYISEPERRAVFAAAGQANVSHDDIIKYLTEAHGVTSTGKLTRAIADDLLNWLKTVKKVQEGQ